MRQLPRSLLVAGCMLLAACDMYTWLDVRHAVQPAPSYECIGSVLASTPGVTKVGKPDRQRGWDKVWVEFEDSTTRVRQDALLIRDSTGLSMHYAWGVGVFVRGPSAAELQEASYWAREVLTQVRNACAPNAPAVFECVIDRQRVVNCASPAA